MNKNKKIFLTGHNGLVGSATLRQFKKLGYKNIITINKNKLDLRDQNKVANFFKKKKPEVVIIVAAKVGGIKENKKKSAEFIYDNLQIQNNLIHQSFLNGIKDLIFLGSSCVYPKFARQPIKEKYLLSSELEKTNEAYAIAKISGVKMCEFYNQQYGTNYKSLMPCNTFGPNDNYDFESSHFIAALIRKIYEAKINNRKEIKIWGNGKTKRELIFVDDIADAIIFFVNKKTKESLINIGTQKDYSIIEYANIIMKLLNVKLKIKKINRSLKGTPRKILNISLAKKLGWNSKTSLVEGLKITLNDFKKNYKQYT